MITIKEYVNIKKKELCEKVSLMSKKPHITIVQVNDDYASNAYIRGKLKDVEEIGAISDLIKLPVTTTEEELLKLIDKLNNDSSVDGFIVQLPLPKTINEAKVKLAINPQKDLDGFHPLSKFLPATPKGILTFLEDEQFDFEGKNALVIGRSEIVGKPMARLLLNKNMTVAIAHSKTPSNVIKDLVAMADLIVVAVGKSNFLTNDFNFKKSCFVIDVGINRDSDNKLVGDCEKDLKVAYQSPVPGGVGLLTRLALLINLLEA